MGGRRACFGLFIAAGERSPRPRPVRLSISAANAPPRLSLPSAPGGHHGVAREPLTRCAEEDVPLVEALGGGSGGDGEFSDLDDAEPEELGRRRGALEQGHLGLRPDIPEPAIVEQGGKVPGSGEVHTRPAQPGVELGEHLAMQARAERLAGVLVGLFEEEPSAGTERGHEGVQHPFPGG